MISNLRPLFLLALMVWCSACNRMTGKTLPENLRYEYGNILNIRQEPDAKAKRVGCFTDEGAWMGFTLPEKESSLNGFCGPFSIDNRYWFARSVAEISFMKDDNAFRTDTAIYFPGEVYLSSRSSYGKIEQRLNFVSASTALLHLTSNKANGFRIIGKDWNKEVILKADNNTLIASHPTGEMLLLTFDPNVKVTVKDGNYSVDIPKCKEAYVAISFLVSAKELDVERQHAEMVLSAPQNELKKNTERWNGYLKKILRTDMPLEYNRIAVKSVVTLTANWRTHRGGLLHDGVIPSHAVNYFIGFWAWDSWRFSVALARFNPNLAKNNIRAMFDYQQPDGMIIDCIYTDPKENNARDSKPPLVCWAVDEIYTHTNDTAFVREMYPQLLAYYKWWYAKRDHNHNGICEFGSTDGTLEAAAWESGMDNAIRFDSTTMVKNGENAWSMDQESVDLNAYLAVECRLLKKFAGIINERFDAPDYSAKVADYFFDNKVNFFCDRKLKDGAFIEHLGCEGYSPFWAEIASKEQMQKALSVLRNPNKFSTYIPFPTAAADDPGCSSNGYWRGPIWLDQTYTAINGLRKYGYNQLADSYTLQVFDRLQGLTADAPICENYGTHTGERLQAPHFSWSAAHLLLLYEEYGK